MSSDTISHKPSRDSKQVVESHAIDIENLLIECATESYFPPFHLFKGIEDLKELILAYTPELESVLTDHLLERLWDTIQRKFCIEIGAALVGISNEKEMATYLDKTGILADIDIEYENVRQALTDMETHVTYQPPLKKSQKEITAVSQCHFPPEYEDIDSVLISWPKYLKKEWKTIAHLVLEISSVARVYVIIPNKYWHKAVEYYIDRIETTRNGDKSNIKYLYIPTDSVWCRDYGPTTVLTDDSNIPVFMCNIYKVRGFPNHPNDRVFSEQLGRYMGIPTIRVPLTFEGGNIITDGHGTIFMTEAVLAQNDNDRNYIEKILRKYYGASRVIIVPSVKGESAGHIDPVMKFVDQKTILLAKCPQECEMYHDLERIADILANMKTNNGKRGAYRIVRIHVPSATITDPIGVTQYSYINSLIVNKKVIVPLFNCHQEDEKALKIYRDIFTKDFDIVGVQNWALKAGGIHCTTKEMNACKKKK